MILPCSYLNLDNTINVVQHRGLSTCRELINDEDVFAVKKAISFALFSALSLTAIVPAAFAQQDVSLVKQVDVQKNVTQSTQTKQFNYSRINKTDQYISFTTYREGRVDIQITQNATDSSKQNYLNVSYGIWNYEGDYLTKRWMSHKQTSPGSFTLSAYVPPGDYKFRISNDSKESPTEKRVEVKVSGSITYPSFP